MSTASEISSGSDFMPSAQRIRRLRAKEKENPYNPARPVADWDDPDVIELEGFISSSTSMETPDGARDQTSSTAYLTIADPSADVRKGDRVEVLPHVGRSWEVTGFPSTDANPFTGWQPTLEASLEEVLG